jgi:integrase/recombinase XerD
MKDLSDLLESFIEELKVRNLSKRTIDDHLWRLGRFFKFMEGYNIRDIHEITEEHIRQYQRHRYYYRNKSGSPDSISVQNHYIQSVRCFFTWLKRDAIIARDPAEQVKYAKEPSRLPKSALTNTEMKKLLRQTDTTSLVGYRDRAVLEVFYSTGLRKSELINLNLGDIDYNEGYVRVNCGKGAKDRVVPIGHTACRYVETYVKAVRPLFMGAGDNNALFIGRRGRRLCSRRINTMVKKYARTAGIEKDVTTHTFRRSCATEMIKNNANLMHVKELLGHSSLDTVQRYCSLTITDLKAAHKKCHPREKDQS